MTGPTCCQCPRRAAIIDHQTGKSWCADCAVALIRAGDPITEYTELAGGQTYTAELERGTTATLRFR